MKHFQLYSLALLSLLFLSPIAMAIGSYTETQKKGIVSEIVIPYIESLDANIQLGSTAEELAQTESQLESTQDVLSQTESILESTQDELLDANSQIDTAELLLSGTAIPDASAIDAIIANLFSLTPHSGVNPTSPLLDQINLGLIPYLQSALANLGELNPVKQISAGGAHTVVLTSNGKVYATGLNSSGQLGTGDLNSTNTLVAMAGTRGVIAVAAGSSHTIILKDDGSVWGVGNNNNGQLGTGVTGSPQTSLVPMIGAGTSGVVAIAAGSNVSFALKNDSSAWATGLNTNGQLGISTNFSVSALTAMTGAGTSGVVAISTGILYSTILKNNGSVWASGTNSLGQLGTSNNVSTNALTAMTGAGTSGVKAVSAGDVFTAVLKNDGSVWATGENGGGQLGIGITGGTRNTLTAMIGAGTADVTDLAASSTCLIALKNDGSVWAVGLNNFGQMGTGNTTNTNVLVPMVGAGTSGVTAITAKINQTVVLKNNGSIWGTGRNTNGQLGIGNNTNTNVLTAMNPTPVVTSVGVTSVALQ